MFRRSDFVWYYTSTTILFLLNLLLESLLLAQVPLPINNRVAFQSDWWPQDDSRLAAVPHLPPGTLLFTVFAYSTVSYYLLPAPTT